MLSDTHTFTPTLINDLRLNYTRGRFSNTIDPVYDPATGQNLNTLFGLPSITKGGLPSFNSLFPGSSLGGGGSTATGFGGAGSTNVDDREQRYAITDILYKTLGTHSIKFGGMFQGVSERDSALWRIRRRLYVRGHADQLHRHIGRHRRRHLRQFPAGRTQHQCGDAQRGGSVLLPLE